MVLNPPEYLQKKFLLYEKPRMGHSLNKSQSINLIRLA